MFDRAHARGPGRGAHAVRGCTALIAAMLLSLVVAVPAWASSIVYLDHNDDIWMISPDGATKRQITTNGSTMKYSSPSMTDAGVIVAGATHAFFYYFNRDGTSAGGPWTAFDMNCASMQQPISNQVKPDGGMNVYWFLDNGSACWSFLGPTVAFASYNGLTGKDVFATFDGAWYPRWVPGTTYAAAVQESGASIQTLNTVGGTPWIVDSDSHLRYFDISRTGNKVLIAKSDTGELGSPTDLVLWQNVGTPPASGHAVCAAVNWGHDNQAPDISIPRWSPDGSAFTWSDNQGVWVSPAPVASGANCVIHPKLIAPGGSYPDWGLPDVLTPGPTADQITSVIRKVGSPSGKAAKIPAILKKGSQDLHAEALNASVK